MPKRSPAKIDYRDCEKRGRRCLLISQQCRWRFGKISLSVFRYDTSSDSAIGKQLKLPVRSILNQSQLNHVWDQYGRCLYACTIDDKLVVKRDSVVFVEVRSRYTFTTSWKLPAVRFDQLWYVQAAHWLQCMVVFYRATLIFFYLPWTCRVIHLITVWQWQLVILSLESW